ncbi:Histidine kinase-, DNA gyrase B-, and HSP90-like ATPase [Thermoflavimicrobium dichotomicum]|uniref:histidine kinase n=2 Tax=Thermoflavimicrobium dichotomicum TaxID=46223 RepID=A0A1I3TAN1_9BACL|nr:Histidine kinase-, DNA gyrase B-, and HSP90-like ATPase [Thermoflavimicrobium dichotomicum]
MGFKNTIAVFLLVLVVLAAGILSTKDSPVHQVKMPSISPSLIRVDIESIWERFYKADRARTKKAGTGLGLSIVKHILDLHQSPIHVKSEVRNGSIFTFTLPIAPNMSKKPEKE